MCMSVLRNHHSYASTTSTCQFRGSFSLAIIGASANRTLFPDCGLVTESSALNFTVLRRAVRLLMKYAHKISLFLFLNDF